MTVKSTCHCTTIPTLEKTNLHLRWSKKT